MKGFEAVLFDMDGTLIYSKGVISRCINDTLKHFNIEPFNDRELRELVGVPLRSVFAIKTPECKELIDQYRTLYLSTYLNGTNLYDGMVPILDMLKSNEKKIGVVTLKHTHVAQKVLKGLNIQNFVDAVDGDDDISDLKPSPFQITRICKTLGVKPEQSLMIGDTAMDITAGRDANCKTIGVLWGASSMDVLTEAGCDFLARSPKELQELLRRL